MRPLVVLACFAAFAGCVDASGPAASSPTPSTPLDGFLSPVTALEACAFARCYEPTVAVDNVGRLFVADGSTSAVAVSEDNGTTWVQRTPPPMLGGLRGVQSDVLLQVAPSGRLYWSALVIITEPAGAGFVLEGIQVAWSDDGATSWAGNVHISPRTLTAQVVGPDRQWLGFAPDGTLYLTYNQVPTGIWFARSMDEGKTWTGWTRVAPLEGRAGGIGQSGPPVVDSKGRVFVPACGGVAGNTLVFYSDNKGQSWSSTSVPGGCSWFPIIAVGPADQLVLAVQPGAASVASSEDRGRTFGPLRAWGPGATASAWPLITESGDLVLSWFSVSGGRADLHVGRGPWLGGVERDQVVAVIEGGTSARTPALTDFASSVLLADGRVATVFVKEKQALVAIGNP